MMYDVVVVGGGPTGSTAARYAAAEGARVLLLEEHASIGTPIQCTGLLSVRALSQCDIRPDDEFILNSVRGAHVHAPGGTCVPIDGGKTKAYVVSRKMFDRRLAIMAADQGVDLMVKAKVVGLKTGPVQQEVMVIHNGMRRAIAAKVVIGADGVQSTIARMVGLGRVQRILSGVQVEAPYASNDNDFVELFVGSCAPGFFSWTVPISDSISRIGLAVEPGNEQSAFDYLQTLIRDRQLTGRCDPGFLDHVVGGIPMGPLARTYAEGVLIVGDAAGQVKPTSGGGVYPGTLCARIAGEVAATAALEGDVSAPRLCEYDTRWRFSIGRELGIGMKIHDFIARCNDSELDDLLGSLNNPAIIDLITEYGDMDHPSILIKKMLNPRYSRHMLGVMRAFARAVL
ncbi:MAG: NAD(P)/FAD-dependent oxidoreductase [Euryarchaeota archaeon]|nr:NAD(P)/FAD-dependent oxidoreductase [Euryarchaeota archaeon]